MVRRWLAASLAGALLGAAACGAWQDDKVAARAAEVTGRPREVDGDAELASVTVEPVARLDLRGMPGPARGRIESAVRQNAECERCHVEVAREWRGSLHQRANIEPSYRRAFEIEPMPFCRSCHAPEADPLEPEPKDVGDLGVGCVTCHVAGEGEEVLAAPLADGAVATGAPHAVVRDVRFAESGACASCHEFAFPTARGIHGAELMQSTVSEHRASKAAKDACASCHMPTRAVAGMEVARADKSRRRHHGFVASRDEGFVRSAARASAVRTSPTSARVTIEPLAGGHAFPTGDLFRRLEVSVEAVGPDEMALGSATQYLTRHFMLRPGAQGRALVRDDRPRDEPVTLDLDVGADGAGRDLVWRVAYQRVAHPLGVDAADSVIDGEIVIAEGRLR